MMQNTPPDPETAAMMLRPYRAAGYELFPLGRGRKTPRDKGWQTRTYRGPELKDWLGHGGNIGIRLRDCDLVLDLDPRNFSAGDDPFQRLCADVDTDLGHAPTVMTGRGDGGRHLYFLKPAGLRIVGKLDAYPGIDFRSRGAFVVGPGSRHPDTGGLYEADTDFAPPIGDVAMAPESLLALLARPELPEASGDAAGRLTNEQLETLLGALDPCQYGAGKHDDWLRLMAACHDATAGHGLPVWLAWCGSDPAYDNAEDEAATTSRWQSFTPGRSGGATYRTLLKAVADAGRPDLVAALGDEVISDFVDFSGPVFDPIQHDAPVIDIIDQNARIADAI